MKTALKKKLSLLLVLVLIVSLFAGLSINANAETGTKNLTFTSDLHFDKAKTNPLDSWLTNMKTVVKSVDYMGFCGDMGSAYAASTPALYWEQVQAAMDVVDGYVKSGFITNKAIYAFGNHEWYTVGGGDYANNSTNATAQKYTPNGEAVKTNEYIIYSFGATGTKESFGAAQQFAKENIATLKTYLDAAPKNIPIIIMSHFPIHTFTSRVSTNASELIDMLNMYPNVVFLWGHNHSSSDTNYDKIFTAGESIKVGAANATTDKKINFTYAAAGCMSDVEYGAGGAFVKGKGLLLSIDGSKATFNYYGLDGKNLNITKTVDVAAGTPVAPPAPPAGPVNAFRLSQKVTVNGVDKAFDAYGVDGRSYFKLRDIAFVLNGTGSQFSVDFDANNIFLKTGSAYVPAGGELVIGADKSSTAKLGTMALNIDGKVVSIKAYNIGGNNYFQLRELGDALNFKYAYVDATKTIQITSVEKAAVVDKGAPIGKAYFFASMDDKVCTDTKGAQIVYYPVDIYKGDTIADAITTLHATAYGDGKAWSYSKDDTYGYYFTKMWGKDTGALTYGGGGIWTDFSAGKHADLTKAVTDGAIIYLNNFTGSLYMRTGYFDKQYVELKAGDSLTLTLNRCSGDGVVKLSTSTDVSVNGTVKGTTDGTTAKVTLTFDKAGTYIVTGAAKNSYGVGMCCVVVK